VSPRPAVQPIGITLAAAAKGVSRAFDDALAAAGGSRPTWLVLLALKRAPTASQRELADVVGIRGATLTHHLGAMEAEGLIARRRDPANRRVQVVELTAAGEARFLGLRDAAAGFDARLRAGLGQEELDALRATLARLAANVSDG
jgi:MarR family transcriptional regulator, transcriptional regulator for hemolysin